MSATDRSLVARARAGDTQAYAALLERHRGRLLRTCARSLGDPAAAADVAQDAALVAWLQLDRLQDPARFGAWLAGIGRVLSLRVLRERAASPERLTRDGSLPDHAADRRDDPAERLLARERAGELAAAISALPDGQRDAVVLFHLADLPQATIAARLGTAAGAVRTRLHKARAALRTRLTAIPDTSKERPVPQTAVPARIVDVRRTPAARHVVVLATDQDELPIWIGAPEAEALVAALEQVELPRPHAHALALSLVRACGRSPASVRITRLDAAIFYAEVMLDDDTAVDARPSDALVLAVAAGIPIEIDPTVLPATRSGAPAEYAEDLARAAHDGAALLAEELRAGLAARAAELERLQEPPGRS
jgi:RNA polymerase sigma-70 factor (ECF subfamily)